MNEMTTQNHNKNERVKLVIRAHFQSREMADFVCEAAMKSVNEGIPMPEEFDDVFLLEIVTRPSGSKYGILDFA